MKKPGVFDPWRQQEPPPPPPRALDAQASFGDTSGPMELDDHSVRVYQLVGKRAGINVRGNENEADFMLKVAEALVEVLHALPLELRDRYKIATVRQEKQSALTVESNGRVASVTASSFDDAGLSEAIDNIARALLEASRDKDFLRRLEELQITPYLRWP